MGNVIASLDQKEYQTLLSYLLDLPNSIFIKNANLQNYKKIAGKENLKKYKVIGEDQDIYIIPLDKKQTQNINQTNIGQEIMRIILYHLFMIEKPNQSIFTYLKNKKQTDTQTDGYYIPNELIDYIKTNKSIYITEATLEKNTNITRNSSDIFNTSRSVVPSIIDTVLKDNRTDNTPNIINNRMLIIWNHALLKYTPSQDPKDYQTAIENESIEQYYKKHKDSELKNIFPHIDSIIDYIERHNEEQYQKLKEEFKEELYMDDDILKNAKFKKVVDYTQTNSQDLISSLFVNLPVKIDVGNLNNNPFLPKLKESRFVKYAEMEKNIKLLIKNDLLKNYTLCLKSNSKVPVLSDKTGTCFTNSLLNTNSTSYKETHKTTASILAESLTLFLKWFINDINITIDMIKHLRKVK